MTAVESKTVQDAADLSTIGCSSESGENDAEGLAEDQEQRAEQAVSILFQKSNTKDLHEDGEKTGRRASVLKMGCGMVERRHPSKNRTHVP